MLGSGMVECGFSLWMVSIAGTLNQILQGLKGVKGLPFETGLLCNYSEDCRPVIDTTNMLFNTDVIFISSGMEVVDTYKELIPGIIVASRELAQYSLQLASASSIIAELRRVGISGEELEEAEEDIEYGIQMFPRVGSTAFISYFIYPTED